MSAYRITVNGEPREFDDPTQLLVLALREGLGLTGTKIGCDSTSCGACTVLMDGAAVKSCTILVGQADGTEVTTVEGLSTDGMTAVQESFRDEHALQCGFCTPGFVISTTALLSRNPAPDDAAVREALEGNICRCTGYTGILNAVQRAAARTRGEAVAPPEAGTRLEIPLAVIEVTDEVGEASDVEVV